MAAELAKVSLWLEALEPGKPLSYLDQNIRVGNSLLGVTPALLGEGLPDEAFTPIEGDDRKVCGALKKQNLGERDFGERTLDNQSGILVTNATIAKQADAIAHTLPENLEDLHIQQQRQAEQLAAAPERRIQKLLADAWCAAFVQPKTLATRATAITHAVLERFSADEDGTLDLAEAESRVAALTRQYRFFHWHVEFPHIFRTGGGVTDVDPKTGWSGGFSCVIGNPPWERVKLQAQEFFAARNPDIANAPNAAVRKKLIAALPDTDTTLYNEFQAELRKSAGWSFLLRESGRYPLTGRGDVNTYAVFAETARTVIGPRGRSGLVLPTGIATDATTAPFFSDLVRNARLVSFLEFENEAFLLSRAVDHRVRFSLLTVCGRATRVDLADFAFGTRYMRDLSERRFRMPPEEILLVNPNTGTTPIFRSRRDAEITIGIYKRVPILWRREPSENPWHLSFMRMFDITNDASLFETKDTLTSADWKLTGNIFTRAAEQMRPLYEAKMAHQFDHRLGTYEGQTEKQANMGTLPHFTSQQKDDPALVALPQYWVNSKEVAERLARRTSQCDSALLGYRRVARSTDERSCIASLIPRGAVSYGLILTIGPSATGLACLDAAFNSFAFDYILRNSFSQASVPQSTFEQIAIPPPSTFTDLAPWTQSTTLLEWIKSRVLELTYSAYDVAPFARDLGDEGPPFRWDEERRFAMRAELDAAFFHLYGIDRDDMDYIMETFPVVKRRDIQQYDTFRTKDLILKIYDAMAEAIRTGTPYQALLDPPPGQASRHPPR
jgi:hypothetical protein